MTVPRIAKVRCSLLILLACACSSSEGGEPMAPQANGGGGSSAGNTTSGSPPSTPGGAGQSAGTAFGGASGGVPSAAGGVASDAGQIGAAGSSGGSAGASMGGGTTAGGDTGPLFAPDYIMGADISWTLEDEAHGFSYADAGGVKPIEQIMVNSGFNFIRLRTFVNPKADGGYSRDGFCDVDHTITMAKRVKACGMGFFLDFHMSDTWASIGVQKVPSAWAGMSPADMQKAAYEYVKSVMTKLVAAGVKPDMVQIGNETQGAMSGVSLSNWANFSGLVNAGIKAVRETDPKIFIWGQHGQPRPEKNFAEWSDKYLAGNPKIDVDGLCGSTYGTNNDGADWKESFGHVIDVYKRPVMSCEYTDVKRDLLNEVMRGFPSKLGRGAFLWEPTRYPGVNENTLFTRSGSRYTTNASMDRYKALAQKWGLPVPSGVCK